MGRGEGRGCRPAPEGLALSAVLPCYEEERVLPTVVAGLVAALERLAARWEILLVTADGVSDATPALARELAARDERVRCLVQRAGDLGYGRALAMGLAACRYDLALIMDADGQLDPRDLRLLVGAMREADLVVGYRAHRADPWPRRAAGAVYSRVVSALLGIEGVRDLDCAFKLVPLKWLGDEPLLSRTGAVNAELLARAQARGARVKELAVSHLPRRTGRARFEMHLGIVSHLPHPAQVWSIFVDVAGLMARQVLARRVAPER